MSKPEVEMAAAAIAAVMLVLASWTLAQMAVSARGNALRCTTFAIGAVMTLGLSAVAWITAYSMI